MVTDFTMPVQQFTASPSQYTLYNSQSQQTSPINSVTTTPSSSSPTSPRASVLPFLPAHTRQLRPPKSPLYVPAVLRPTDPPKRTVKPSLLTPPVSRDNSFDPFENSRVLSRRSTGKSSNSDLDSVLEHENSTDDLGKVTALPTRKHWKPDPESTVCDEAVCTRFFTYFTRRHHCRHCGNIFCDLHSVYNIPLDQDAKYHPRGTQSRACERCWIDYCSWQRARHSPSNSESSQSDQEAPETPITPSTPIINCKDRFAIASIFESKNQGTPESFGKSVPRDWNWSTF